MISGICILNSRGDVLISRVYRDDISRGIAEAFRLHVLNAKEVRSPIKTLGSTFLLHVRHGDIYVLAVTKQNVNCCLVFEMLKNVLSVFRAYFDGKVTEETIRNNFVLIYELLDEILDYGYPQTTDTEALKLYITQGKARQKESADKVKEERLQKITVSVTGAGPCPWREPGIKYRKNELFIDVVESVNLLMSAKGNILNMNVAGQVIMKSLLSGMPECRFGLNDKLLMAKEGGGPQGGHARRKRSDGIELDDCTFHQCVKLGKFDTDRTISFIPPDGVFELMKYRITENLHLPFKIIPIVNEIGRTRVEAKITVKANFSPKLFGSNVMIKLPVPKNTAACKIQVTAGKAKYRPEQEAILWRIRRFPGGAEASLSTSVKLISSVNLEKRQTTKPPIAMQFQVPMFTASGLHVRFLKVFEKSHYETIKWVRYVTKAGNYEFRV
ncbi:AP-2 complex subunit mu [Balamuthia mandrillaris]